MGAIGFADDYSKVVKKKKGGMRARTKFFFQVLVAFAAALFLYYQGADTVVSVPFFKEASIDLKAFYIPFVVFVIVGTSNAVNLGSLTERLSATARSAGSPSCTSSPARISTWRSSSRKKRGKIPSTLLLKLA